LREKFFEFILSIAKETYFSISVEMSPIWNKFKWRTKSRRSTCFDKWSSDKEHIALQVGSKSALCLLTVNDLLQKQTCHRQTSDFPGFWYRQLFTVWNRPLFKWQMWIFYCVFGFWCDTYYVC